MEFRRKIIILMTITQTFVLLVVLGLIILFKSMQSGPIYISSAITSDSLSRLDLDAQIGIENYHNMMSTVNIKLDERMILTELPNNFYQAQINDSLNGLEIEFQFQEIGQRLIATRIKILYEDTAYYLYDEQLGFNSLISKHYKCNRDKTYLLSNIDLGQPTAYMRIKHLEYQLKAKNGSLAKGFQNGADPHSCTTDSSSNQSSAISDDHKSRIDLNASVFFLEFANPPIDIRLTKFMHFEYRNDRPHQGTISLKHIDRFNYVTIYLDFARTANGYDISRVYLKLNQVPGQFNVQLNQSLSTPLDKHYKCDQVARLKLTHQHRNEMHVGYLQIGSLEFEFNSNQTLEDGFSGNAYSDSCLPG